MSKVLRSLFLLGFAAAAGAPDSSDFDFDDSDGGTVITGQEHLPDFTVVIDRENLTKAYDLKLEESFLPKIIEAIEKEPF